ncbi:MAG TPA: hypothetical protein VNZ01_07385 [Solirubrobacteraceae bacterium]|jgi:hypothetical protein|nr:hypothetical protein [Solirubrobacteraceae bacterium]
MRSRPYLPLLLALIALGACAAAAVASHRSAGGRVRVWKEHLAAPAQFDLSLAQVSFGASARVAASSASRPRHASSVRVQLRGPSGLDYVAAAITRFTVFGRPRALLLVVNRRPRGSLAPDLARIDFTVSALARLGDPLLQQISNPFTHPTGLTPALCDLPIRGAALAGADLRPVLSRGPAPGGFSAAASIAQAYDAVCGRPFSASFKQAVTQGSLPPCETGKTNALPCCPPNAMCLPPPCPPCPCGVGPCPVPVAAARKAAIACPLQTPPIACPL